MRRLRSFILPALLLCGAVLQPQYAVAKDSMKFSFERQDFRPMGMDLYQIFYAEGPITEGTAERLRVLAKKHKLIPGGAIYLQSEGGNLLEGIKLGRIIRELGLTTYIGTKNAKVKYCLSACTLAYLGGISRYMTNDNTVYGVHRFYRSQVEARESDIDAAQVISAEIIGYMNLSH